MSESNSLKSNRIAKNTGLLYTRMILVILLKLYTSRIALEALGIIDYGIYNLVAGIIVLFSFLNSSMSGANVRFFTTAMGKSDNILFQKYYSASLCVHIIICIITIILSESFGLYYFYDLNIPPDRITAAFWAYQISILYSIIEIIKSPFNANIIAHEKMSFYAYMSILEVILGLATAFCVMIVSNDKLITYTLLMSLTGVVSLTLYIIYCNHQFNEVVPKLAFNKSIIKEITTFVAWSISSSFANIFSKQAFNVLINLFYGVTLNAATAIMNQVTVAIYGFVQNFQTAINPQIFKSFAAKENSYLQNLFLSASKISFYLLWLISLPFILCMSDILNIWLSDVPPYAAEFCILSLIALMPNSIGGPVWTVIQASGYIKKYQLIICAVTLLNIPCYYLLLKIVNLPFIALTTTLVSNIIIVAVGFKLTQKHISIPFNSFAKNVIIPVIKVVVISCIIPYLPVYFNLSFYSPITKVIIIGLVSIISVGSTIYFVGLSLSEKRFLTSKIKSITHRHE